MTNSVLNEDLRNFSLDNQIIHEIANKKFMITGATGLIGSMLVRCLLSLGIGIKLILPVRNRQKALELFEGYNESLKIEESDLVDYFVHTQNKVDFIIHCASPTNGVYMMEHPLETFLLATQTTDAVLNYAGRIGCKSVVYISSVEYYGEIHGDRLLDETAIGYVNHNSLRSSYPLGKQAAEFISYCYSKEYGVNVKIARLTQTFGAGVSKNDNRVFMQFARSILKGEDIILHTTGNSAKPYCYSIDCVKAILYILLLGQSGEAYNVANPDTYMTVRELAEFLCKEFNPRCKVVVKLNNTVGYAPETHTNLCIDKLMKLGWRPEYNLKSMFCQLLRSVALER